MVISAISGIRRLAVTISQAVASLERNAVSCIRALGHQPVVKVLGQEIRLRKVVPLLRPSLKPGQRKKLKLKPRRRPRPRPKAVVVISPL